MKIRILLIILIITLTSFKGINFPLKVFEVSKVEYKMNEVLKVALSQWNFKEIQGKYHNPEIVKYFQEIGYKINNDETAWCSAFLNWCAMKAGYEYTTKLNARSWQHIGIEVPKNEWKLGDVVVLWRSSPESWKGHVGLYIRHDENYIYLLGGNQSNRVTISKYSISRVIAVRELQPTSIIASIN